MGGNQLAIMVSTQVQRPIEARVQEGVDLRIDQRKIEWRDIWVPTRQSNEDCPLKFIVLIREKSHDQ